MTQPRSVDANDYASGAPGEASGEGAWVVFDAWIERQRAQREFDAVTVPVYRSFWRGWLDWLHERGQHWLVFPESLVGEFLNGPPPKGLSRPQRRRQQPMANYTRQRYYRVLRGVYHEAGSRGLLDHNPVLRLPEDQVPTIAPRSRASQVLPPGVLAMLRDAATLRRLLGPPSPSQWWKLRDQALVMLLATTAITTRELIALTGEDLRVGTERGSDRLAQRLVAAPGQAPNLALLPGEGVWLVLQESAELLGRSLPVPVGAWPPLLAWAQAREQLLDPADSAGAPWLLSRQRRPRGSVSGLQAGQLPYPPMDSASVWLVVRSALTPLLAAAVGEGDSGVAVAKGAAIVRNSVLQEWVDETDPAETARRAGLSSATHLRVFRRRPDTHSG